jgi:hypothetical protein
MDALAKVQPEPLHDVDLVDGRFTGTSAAQLSAAFVNFTTHTPSDHICVFFHGGLVSRDEALATARELEPGFTNSGSYPFFFVWHSDLLTVIRAKIEPYKDNDGFVKATNILVKLVARKIKGACDTSALLAQLPSNQLRRTPSLNLEDLEKLARPYDKAWTARDGEQLACSTSELREFAQFLGHGGANVGGRGLLFSKTRTLGTKNPLSRVINRLNSGHGHGLYTTVIEELLTAAGVGKRLGVPVWDKMKGFIDDSFADNDQAGGTAFLEHLAAAWAANPRLRVTLIGHSAGAIYVQRFIEALDARLPPERQVDVILMAAAVSFSRVDSGLAVFKRRVKAVRTFGLSDKVESSYWEVPLIYNKSLLYIVSAFCEADANDDKPLVGMQRYWSEAWPYLGTDIADVIDVIGTRSTVWAPAAKNAPAGFRTNAKRHGGMPCDHDTNASVCWILTHGQ